MTSLSVGETEESLFLINEQTPTNLQQSESFDGIKSIQRILSATSSITSTTLPNQQPPYRSLTTNNFTPSSHQSRHINSNDVNSFVHHFERRLDEHHVLWQKEYDKNIQHMIETKKNDIEGLKIRYETKLHELEEQNRQLEILLGQINEENKRLKIEIEHEKQQNKIEQSSMQQRLKEYENDVERKIHEIKNAHENEKQEIKRQNSRMYQDLLDETNQRLKKTEHDCKYQQSTNQSIIDEMEKRMVDLRSNIENLQQIKHKVDDEKIQLIKNNEQLQLQIQELTNKQRHIDRDHTDKIQRYENEIKSVRLRCESSIDSLRKENDLIKTKSTKSIDDLEKKFSTITEKFHDIQKISEQKLHDQQIIYQNNLKQYGNDYEKKFDIIKQELKEKTNQYDISIQQNEKLKNELKQQKYQFNNDLENKIQEINNKTHENEQQLIDKLKFQYEQINQQNEEKLRQNFNKDREELKHKYQRIIDEKEEQIDKLSTETKLTQQNEKQQIVNQYEQFIRKIEQQYSQKIHEYEKRIDILISKTHEQLKSMEDDFEVQNLKQQSIINDQKKRIQTLEDEQNKAKIFYEKQYAILTEECLYEKNEIKAQFDIYAKNLEKNIMTLTQKKEELEHKLTYLIDQHKHEIIQCRLSYENNIQGLLSNDVRLDLENTIHSLKQQVVYLQQRIAFLQQELEQYIQIYGHRL